jgi:hypothetical protein
MLASAKITFMAVAKAFMSLFPISWN